MPARRPRKSPSARSSTPSASSSSKSTAQSKEPNAKQQKDELRKEFARFLTAMIQKQKDWKAQAEKWMDNPVDLYRWQEISLGMQIQWLHELVFKAPPGMVDLKDQLKAAADLRDLVEQTIDAIEARKEAVGAGLKRC